MVTCCTWISTFPRFPRSLDTARRIGVHIDGAQQHPFSARPFRARNCEDTVFTIASNSSVRARRGLSRLRPVLKTRCDPMPSFSHWLELHQALVRVVLPTLGFLLISHQKGLSRFTELLCHRPRRGLRQKMLGSSNSTTGPRWTNRS